MNHKMLSSGDLIADRRADHARGLAGTHDFAAAAEVMRQAIDLAPCWPAGWFSLGTYLEKAGDGEGASDAFRMVLQLTEDDVFGAGMKLATLGQASVPATPPSAFVERLFDDYADRFDRALVERLGYSVPERLAAAVEAARGRGAVFARAVDLGCGTGLMGQRLRAHVSYLEGYDLSAGMLAKARGKGIYDHLGGCDLSLPPEVSGLPVQGSERADLVTAADVMAYLGDLDTVFAAVAAILAPEGLFAFSVERGPEETAWMLRSSLRYAHGETYLRVLAERHGLATLSIVQAPLRRDGAETVEGLLVVMERHGVHGEHAVGAAFPPHPEASGAPLGEPESQPLSGRRHCES